MKLKICIFVVLFFCFCVIFSQRIVLWMFSPDVYKEPKDYKKALSGIYNQEKVSHFPEKIPEQAANVQLYGFLSAFGREILLLKFEIDNEYIQQELKKNEFINKETPLKTVQKIYYIPEYINTKDMTFYVLKNETNMEYYKEKFIYMNGIGVNTVNNEILYYYICPD